MDVPPSGDPIVAAGDEDAILVVRSARLADSALLALIGELDYFSAPQLRGALSDAIDAGVTRVTLDLSAMSFVDTAGLDVMVRARRMLLDRGGDLSIVGVRPALRRLMTVLGLDSRLMGVRSGPR